MPGFFFEAKTLYSKLKEKFEILIPEYPQHERN